LGDVGEQPSRLCRRQRTTLEPRTERLATDEGHHVVRQPVGCAGAQDRHDVRMLQPREELYLALEAVDVDAGRQLGMQHLDHDRPLERPVLCAEDAGHPAAAELAFYGIAPAQRGAETLYEIR